ncbi:MAG: GNAT family N-acetyltransferase [Candidatus Acidiferrales bacterium]
MLETPRLLLRRWRDSDREPFAALNSDPRVMQFFPVLLSRAESGRLVDRIEAHFEKHGFGLFAAELRSERTFIGFVGLSIPDFEAPFMPCVEIGWRLAAAYWNQGLATEGAQAVLAYACDSLHLGEIVSFTTITNLPSRRVMQKIGMTRAPEDDFDHPRLPEGHPLRRHVLYRIYRRQI